jgi:glycosyltransferase involved in cell wall biosynthesis
VDILFLNNYNYRRGGAESVFLGEASLMERNGNKAHIFSRKHPNNMPSQYEKYFPRQMITDSVKPTMAGLNSLLQLIYNFSAKKRLASMLQRIRIDVAHAHNIYGGLTTSVLDLLSEKKIPVVMTLHDYKLICPNYRLMYRGKICEDCKPGKYYMAVRNKCHKDSHLASLIYAFETYFNQRFEKYKKNIRFFIAPSIFMKSKFLDFGWPEEQIEYIPNFLNVSEFDPQFKPGNYFLYIGRLSSAKGILTLIRAFMKLGNNTARLLIVGEGPFKKQLVEKASSDARINFKGYLSGDALKKTTQNALAVILPSELYENAPISILESFAYGKLVIGSQLGGIPELIDDSINGFLFEAGNINDLREKLDIALNMSSKKKSEMGKAARQKVEKRYDAELHYERLIALYHRVLSTV